MTIWEPQRRWVWVGAMPGSDAWSTSIASSQMARQPRISSGSCSWRAAWRSCVRPVFAAIYGRNLDRAIPRLKAWIAG